MADGQDDLFEVVVAACRVASTALPRGERGVEAAMLWLQAFPAACRLGLGDFTDSAPGLFRRFVAAGLIPSCPSDGAMTGAIRLIATVSSLVTGRSPRTWTAWTGSAIDPQSPIAAALRDAVTPAMLRTPTTPATAPRRVGSIRAERDRLAEALAGREREHRTAAERIAVLTAEHDQSVSDLHAARASRERLISKLSSVEADRTALAARVADAEEAVARTKAELAVSQGREESLTNTLAAERGETKRLRDALADAQAQRDSHAERVQELLAVSLDLERRYRAVDAERTSALDRINALQQQAIAARDERDRAKRIADNLQGQVAQFKRDLTAMQAARDKANEEAAARRTELAAARAEVAALQTNLDTVTKDLAEERAARGDADAQSATRRDELSSLKTRAFHLQTRLDLAEKDLKAARGERDAAIGTISDYRGQGERARNSLEAARERIAQLEDEAVALCDKRAAAQRDVGAAKKSIAELEAKLRETVAERKAQEDRLATLTQERDRLRNALGEESRARHAAVEHQTRLTRDLTNVRSERDAANEKIEAARERLRRQTAEIAVRQLRAPLSAEIVAREVEALLGRSHG